MVPQGLNTDTGDIQNEMDETNQINPTTGDAIEGSRLPDVEGDEESRWPLKFKYRDSFYEIPGCWGEEAIADIATSIVNQIGNGLDIEQIKLMIMPPGKLFKYPFPTDVFIHKILRPKSVIKLIATLPEEAALVDAEVTIAQQSRNRFRGGGASTAKPSQRRDWKKIQDESKYTFHTIRPLPYLPNPEKSQRFLERLASDPGIKASMAKHKFSVGLLTEMNPAEHTTHESRTLGLNRNRGEVIELRLRTDRYDGYRDYKVIRKTLCHELSHNVWGDHDSNFWALTREIEKEVEANDWKHGGHRLSNDEFYQPNDSLDDDETDYGGWTGGEYVLGTSANSQSETAGLSRREIMARAAQSRLEKEKAAKQKSPSDEAADK